MHSKILQNVTKYRSSGILFRIAKRSILEADQNIFEMPLDSSPSGVDKEVDLTDTTGNIELAEMICKLS